MQADITDHLQPSEAKKAPWFGSSYLAFILFFLLTTIFTWPLLTNLSSTLPDLSDAADSTWRIGTIAAQLRLDPLHLYNSPAFYPVQGDLTLDELLTGQGLLGAPLTWVFGPVFAYNVLNFSSYMLSGFAMWLLVRYFTRSALAGYTAGVIFAFSPWHIGQYGHLGLGAQFWMVFALLALAHFLDESFSRSPIGRRGLLYLALFTLFFTLQALVAGYYAYFQAIVVALYLVYYFLIKRGLLTQLRALFSGRASAALFRPLLSQAVLLALAAIISLLVLVPFALPFARAKDSAGFERGLQEVEYWSAGVTNLLRTTIYSPYYQPIQSDLLGLETSAERELYPGIIVLLLVGAGLTRRKSRGEAWLFFSIALVGLVLSFGPTLHLDTYGKGATGIPLPYTALYNLVPGFDALRVPQRFGMLFMLGLAAGAGYGVARLYSSAVPFLRAFAMAAPLLVAGEFFVTGLPAVSAPTGAEAPSAYKWLAANVPHEQLLLELPVGEGDTPVNTSPMYMVYGLQHGIPMLNGSSNIVPRGYDRLFYEMRRFPTPATLAIVEALGVDYMLVHTGGLLNDKKKADLLEEIRSGDRLALAAEFHDGSSDLILRLKPNQGRYASLSAVIPPGSTVLLTDQKAINRRLFVQTLPYFIGADRLYFSTYDTIYDSILGGISRAGVDTMYDFAIIYSGDDPVRFGYSPANRVALSDPELDEYIEVYHK